ncbi:MAG TPA: Mth938-like domain-containing protein [Alphaproteobacteria bacterium]
MADITPRLEQGRLVIEGYGGGGFRIAGVRHAGSVIVIADRVIRWPVQDAQQLGLDDLAPVCAASGVEVLLIGCGARAVRIAPALRAGLGDAGISVDAMATGAACRTFNVLALEGRRVAAALIAVD